MIKGRINSIETMSCVDGPGIRIVIFFQGCSLRCVYCHNPETWNVSDGYEVSVGEVSEKIFRYKNYFKNLGGVTFSGGEPLLQPQFLLELLKKCKQNEIHTCIDTAGVGLGHYQELLKYTDLVLYDVKHITDVGYMDVTGRNMKETLKFIQALKDTNTEVWIRQVVVPNINDSEKYFSNFKEYISEIPNVTKVELLPYHTMAIEKYKNLKIPYKLVGIPDMNIDLCRQYQEKYFRN